MKKFLYFLLATAMLATFGCTGDENTNSVGSPNPNTLMPTGTVQGILKDACTNEPIVGAVIDIGVAKATTSETGQYVMKKVPATSYVSPEILVGGNGLNLSGYSGNYSATIDLRNAKNVVTGKNNYPQFAYDEVEVKFSSLEESSLNLGTTSATNHDTPVVGLGNGDYDFYVGQLTTSISGIAVTKNLKPVPNGYTVKLYSLGSHWNGNSATGADGHLIKQTVTKTINNIEGRFEFTGLEAAQWYVVEVIDTDTDVPTKIGYETKRTKCEGTTWFGVQDGDPVIVGSTDVMCPFITNVTPSNWEDINPDVTGGINVSFTFSEPIQDTVHNTGKGLTASDLGGLYHDVYVMYEGNKANFNKTGNIAHTLSWNSDMTTLTVNIPVVGKASVYSVSLAEGAVEKLKDKAGNSLAKGPIAYTDDPCDPLPIIYDEDEHAQIVDGLAGVKLVKQVHFTTYGAAAAGTPVLQLVNEPYDYDDAPQFSWNETPGAKYYNLYCAQNQVWGTTVNVHPTYKINPDPITSTAYTYPNFPGFVENYSVKLTYTCFVVGVDADGLEGPASNVVTASDTVAPSIVDSDVYARIMAGDNYFNVRFSEPMVKSEVQNVANWTLNSAAFTGDAPTITSVVYNEFTQWATVNLSDDMQNFQGGTLLTGPNGRLESTPGTHDATHGIAFGNGLMNTACVTSVANHTTNTAAVPDDVQVIAVGSSATAGQVIINSGANGLCQTAAQTDEAQAIAVGNGLANQLAISAGAGYLLEATVGGDDVASMPILITVSGVHDVAGNAIRTTADSVLVNGDIE